MNEKLFSRDYWFSLRTNTRVNGQTGRLRCPWWCEDVLQNEEVSQVFVRKTADLGDIQIDQYATSRLSHHWLEAEHNGERFIADGTAGQFDPQYPDGFYGTFEQAPDSLKQIYSKKI